MDAEVTGIEDEVFRIMLVDQLEAVVGRDPVGVDQALVDAVGDRAHMLAGLALEQGDADEWHGGSFFGSGRFRPWS